MVLLDSVRVPVREIGVDGAFSLVEMLAAIVSFDSGEAISDTGRVLSLQEVLAIIGRFTGVGTSTGFLKH